MAWTLTLSGETAGRDAAVTIPESPAVQTAAQLIELLVVTACRVALTAPDLPLSDMPERLAGALRARGLADAVHTRLMG